MTILGIDPGLSGAAALYTGEPDNPTGGTIEAVRRDFKDLDDIADGIKALAAPAHYAVIELVGARPGQGVCSMFSFGKSTGTAFGALRLAGFGKELKPVVEVAPLRWQNWVRKLVNWEGDFDARSICSMLFPGFLDFFKRKKDHGTADAVLMATWKLANL